VADDDNLTMTFTRVEWRLLAIAAMKLRKTDLIGGDLLVPISQSLALRIAKESGK
jgi:hypothetical protein